MIICHVQIVDLGDVRIEAIGSRDQEVTRCGNRLHGSSKWSKTATGLEGSKFLRERKMRREGKLDYCLIAYLPSRVENDIIVEICLRSCSLSMRSSMLRG